jgi:membrane-associated phospholipid phosphatase
MKKTRYFLLISFFTLVICLLLINYFDKSITLFCYEKRNHIIIKIFDTIKDGIYFPTVPIYLLCIILAFLFKKLQYTYQFIFFLLADIFTQLFTTRLKYFFGRSRPYAWIEKQEYVFDFFNGYKCYDLLPQSYAFNFFGGKSCYDSFPSGHSSSVFCLAFSVGLFYPALRLPLLAYAVLIALARVITTVHYLSDVIFGAYLAFFVVYSGYEIYKYAILRIFKLSLKVENK